MQKILIVIDMQDFFVTGHLADGALAIVPAVVEKIKGFDGPVYVTQDINPSCDENSPGFAIYPQILDALPEGAVYFHKRTFGCVELAQAIRDKYGAPGAPGPEGEPLLEIEFCGVCTNVCVISNALMLKAFLPKARITLDSACCAGFTPELHQAALDVMKSCRIDVV